MNLRETRMCNQMGVMRARGFTLMETMVSVAIIGVISTLAVVSLGGVKSSAELGGATEQVLGFVHRARMQAMIDRKCVQMLLLPKAANKQQMLLLRELNSFDCEGTSGGYQNQGMDAPFTKIDASKPLWMDVDRVIMDSIQTTASFVNHPASLTDAHGAECPAGLTPCRELRFRPNGRIWSPDEDFTNDDVTVEVAHAKLDVTKSFVIAGNGTIKTLPRGY